MTTCLHAAVTDHVVPAPRAHADDHDLARFLKARNWDATAARHMWESMLVWRRENRADTINTWFVFHERQEYDKLYPTGLHKTDKKASRICGASTDCMLLLYIITCIHLCVREGHVRLLRHAWCMLQLLQGACHAALHTPMHAPCPWAHGTHSTPPSSRVPHACTHGLFLHACLSACLQGHPVLVQKLGRVNIGALYKLTSDERLRLAHIAECEHLRKVVFPVCSRHAGRHVDQLFTIIDLDGVAFT